MNFEPQFKTERAWNGGPLRVVGSGNGKPSRYVCDQCRRSCKGVRRVKQAKLNQERWFCDTCRIEICNTSLPVVQSRKMQAHLQA